MTSASVGRPRLIALDWGTTHARAYLLGGSADGPVVRDQSSGEGILSVAADDPDRDGAFAAILERMVGGFLDEYPGLPMIACGMIGASQGWRTAQYRTLPTELAGAGGLVVIDTPRGPLPVIAGVKKSAPEPDVIRGEETQLAGLAPGLPEGQASTVLLPGTHSKWALVRDGRLLDFHTAMTGEVFALLSGDSMVARVAEPPAPGHDWRIGFDRGLELATGGVPGDVLFKAFTIRSAVLDEQLPPTQVIDCLSGLLIGSEVATRSVAQTFEGPILVCGGEALVERYRRALDRAGLASRPAPADATVRGLWHSALGAGLIKEEQWLTSLA
ncbi:2-dehydro-3-deoxygalactonokinase [Brooklawnia cerclae]|uniref:2-dehydro-3-deoxygalactonokinase n=1 Tax=Brooklawnia cerclae TaxID=349934 RepID=A0ABX0SLZ9_9ACTN|nr:2-dehydro-3-deoxygalactonokinase [Brooklawnia cerclae]NIH57786.1 2-dehydro-3-deoxygalactonokinase [Brooklawnia cerclae]